MNNEIIAQLKVAFARAESTASSFSDEQFYQRAADGKWSAAENVQHLFFSVKPLVGLFGKPELMLQFGKHSEPGMSYDEVVALYREKLKNFTAANIVNNVEGINPFKTAQIEILHSIHAKFIERAAGLPDAILDEYQIPHPLLGMLSVREFLYFTHHHTLHHTQSMAAIKAG